MGSSPIRALALASGNSQSLRRYDREQPRIIMMISDKMRANEQQGEFRELELLDLVGEISRARTPSEIYRAATQGLLRALAADSAALLIFDENDGCRFQEWIGISDEYRDGVTGHRLWYRSARDTQLIAVSDVTQDVSFSPWRQTFAGEGIRSLAFIPLMESGLVIGKFMISYNEEHEFHDDELQVAQAIVSHAAFVAEQRHAEQALRDSEQRFRATFFQAAVGITHCGATGEWLLVNDRFCEIVGYTRSELSGMTIFDITHPDDRQRCVEAVSRLLAGELPSYSVDKRYIRKDGAAIWVRLYVTPVWDGDKRLQYLVGIVEDITEKTAAEQALRESELLNKQVFDNIPECIFMLDVTLEGRFKFKMLNPAEEEAVGLTSAEVSGKFVDDVLSEAVSRKVIANYRRCLETGLPISYEDELDLEVGRRYFHTNLIPLRNVAGRIHRIAGCCTDLTEIKRRQEEALAGQKLESIGILANGIAHDFNNLLGGILAQAELAAAELTAGEFPFEGIERIKASASRGAEMVRELMIYSGQEETERVEPVDLSSLVEEMLELLKISISKHAVLKTDLNPRLPAVLGRASQLRQVVMNLIINASEAIGENEGVIKVSTSRPIPPQEPSPNSPPHFASGDYLKLEVTDTGGGMTGEAKAKAFDPFFSTKFAGRGLGLAVVQGIVRDHGGAINLDSAPGQGTRFAIFLPYIAGTAPSDHSAIAGVSMEEHQSLAGTVLTVEDEGVLRLAVSKMLRKKGLGVIEACDGLSALELIRSHKDEIDVMLLDVTLPGISGREVFEQALRLRPDLKIILTSAYSRETVDASFAGLRVESFVRKPFRFAELMQLLQDSLSTLRAPDASPPASL